MHHVAIYRHPGGSVSKWHAFFHISIIYCSYSFSSTATLSYVLPPYPASEQADRANQALEQRVLLQRSNEQVHVRSKFFSTVGFEYPPQISWGTQSD